MNKTKGFTLIEMAIVLAIIGILLGLVLSRNSSVIGNAKTTNTIALIKDLSAATNDFKNRYHYLPGDLPKAGDDIPGITGTTCDIATTTANIGNGQIDTNTEVNCVAVELVQAGLIKGTTNGIFSPNNASNTPDVFVTARRTIGSNLPTFPPTVLNEIELTNQPCATAQGIDSKLDDGNFASGNIQASVTSCSPGVTNDPVPYLDIAL